MTQWPLFAISRARALPNPRLTPVINTVRISPPANRILEIPAVVGIGGSVMSSDRKAAELKLLPFPCLYPVAKIILG